MSINVVRTRRHVSDIHEQRVQTGTTQPRKLRVLSVHGEDGQNRTVSEGLL